MQDHENFENRSYSASYYAKSDAGTETTGSIGGRTRSNTLEALNALNMAPPSPAKPRAYGSNMLGYLKSCHLFFGQLVKKFDTSQWRENNEDDALILDAVIQNMIFMTTEYKEIRVKEFQSYRKRDGVVSISSEVPASNGKAQVTIRSQNLKEISDQAMGDSFRNVFEAIKELENLRVNEGTFSRKTSIKAMYDKFKQKKGNALHMLGGFSTDRGMTAEIENLELKTENKNLKYKLRLLEQHQLEQVRETNAYMARLEDSVREVLRIGSSDNQDTNDMSNVSSNTRVQQDFMHDLYSAVGARVVGVLQILSRLYMYEADNNIREYTSLIYLQVWAQILGHDHVTRTELGPDERMTINSFISYEGLPKKVVDALVEVDTKIDHGESPGDLSIFNADICSELLFKMMKAGAELMDNDQLASDNKTLILPVIVTINIVTYAQVMDRKLNSDKYDADETESESASLTQ